MSSFFNSKFCSDDTKSNQPLILSNFSIRKQKDFVSTINNSSQLMYLSIGNDKSFTGIKNDSLKNLIFNTMEKRATDSKKNRFGYNLPFFPRRMVHSDQNLSEENLNEDEYDLTD